MRWLLVLLIAASQAGCFVRLASGGPDGAPEIRNKEFSLEKEVAVLKWPKLPVPYAEKLPLPDPEQYEYKVLATLKPGTKIRVTGSVSRLLPMGHFYWAVCRAEEENLKFDLAYSMGDVIGLPELKRYRP